MKKKEWNEGLDHIDPDLVEQYVLQKDRLRQKKQKNKAVWLRFGAIAACFLLIVSAVIVVPMLREDEPGIITPPDDTSNDIGVNPGPGTTDNPVVNNPDHTPIIFNATVSPEQLNGNNFEFIIGSSSAISEGGSEEGPSFEFRYAIAVKAKVVKNHSDKYYKLDVSSDYHPIAYRLIQMETIEVILGKNVPKYFLYLIPEHVYVDMSVYDSLIISMIQLGAENYVLKNGTRNQMESFELPIFADRFDHPDLGSIIAFTDGIFDESLWQNKNWGYGYQFGKFYLDYPSRLIVDPVVARGDTECAVVSAIKEHYKEHYKEVYPNIEEISVITLDFKTQEAKDALEYVKPFANGVFSQSYDSYGNGQLMFRRYINGCQTEETIKIDLLTEEVTYSEVRYTKEDMEQIENISMHLSEKAAEYAEQLPIPPHTDPEGKELLCLNLYAWYAKVDGNLYGVVKTAWRYQEKDNYFLQYYDAAFVLYDMSAGTAIDISKDDLILLMGLRNVYPCKYGEGIEIPE